MQKWNCGPCGVSWITIIPLEDVQSLTYRGSIINPQGGTDVDVKARIDKARTTFIQLKNIWSSRELTLTTTTTQDKLKIAQHGGKNLRDQ